MEGSTNHDELYTPIVCKDRKPKIGMEFTSIEDAFSFYNQYAREAGFSARMSNSKKCKHTSEVVWKKFVCFKEGHTDELRSSKQTIGERKIRDRARGEIRTGCKSRISIVREQNGCKWVVSTLVEAHNHPLSTPSKVHLLRSHRTVSAAKKALTQQLSEANVPTCQQLRLLEIDYGGAESLGCTERDIRNYEKEMRDEHKGIDAESLIVFFATEKEKDAGFFFDYSTDSDNRLNKVFWADSLSRRAYSVFGDVIVFDTTYNTNKYGMIYAPFVGVNHHNQTTVFGCGFLSDERTETFVWLFEKLLEAMPTGAPKVIITDQDPAITKAIAQVLPQTVHRFCLWHILNKFPDKISPSSFRDYYRSIKNVIENSATPDEFEESWAEVIRHADLEKNDWLSLMYELRHRWVPSYFSHVFCAGMSSSQRVEGSHSFLKRYVSNKNSLMDFIARFMRALRHLRHNELISDHVDINERPKIKTNWPMEAQMVRVYTKKKWVEFQTEMSESHGYFVEQSCTNADLLVYNVMKFQTSSESKARVLTDDRHRDYVSCSCRKFEFEGIPCRHMLAFFRINQVFQLPEKYIMKRWTREAKVGATYAFGEQNKDDDPGQFLVSRHSRLSYKSSLVIDDASLTDEGTNYMDGQLDIIYNKIKEMNLTRAITGVSQKKKYSDTPLGIIDPSEIRTKGSGKRLKSSKEKSTSKARLCRGCGLRGVSHDKRNCPRLNAGLDVEDPTHSDDTTEEEDFASHAGSNNIWTHSTGLDD